jgi:hypothetical protein
MANLYEITGKYLEIQDMINNSDLDIRMLKDTLEGIEYDLEEKADNYAKIIRNITSDIEGLKVEKERLTDKGKALEAKIKTLKSNLEQSMLITNKKKFKTPYFNFNIQKNPPSVNILDKDKIPDKYFIAQDPKIDRKALLKDLKEGIEVDGVEIRQTEGLRIR